MIGMDERTGSEADKYTNTFYTIHRRFGIAAGIIAMTNNWHGSCQSLTEKEGRDPVTNAAEKLDFLMKLTNSQNAALGRALRYDASYISRIRSGKRGLPSEEDFLRPAAAWLAARIREDYQKGAAAERLRLGRPWP